MKIFIINPDYGVTPEQLATRCRLLSAHVGPDVELTMECLTQNKIEIDSALDVALAAPESPRACISTGSGTTGRWERCFPDIDGYVMIYLFIN